MSLDAPSHATPPIQSIDDLIGWLRDGEKPVEKHRVGIEAEKLGVFTSTGEAVPLEGASSIASLLQGLAGRTGGKLLTEKGIPIGVGLKDASIALEPGGQLELSGAPSNRLGDCREELLAHLTNVRAISEPMGLAWLVVGYRPFGERGNVPWLPRGRYALMRRQMPGVYAHDMMQMTASVQANFDFADEADLASKVSCATAVSPIVAAMFANSPLKDGRPSGVKSFRYFLWSDVDRRRSGLLRVMYEPGFTYQRYVEWALSVPLLFIRRRGEYRDPGGRTLSDVIKSGFEGEAATMQDFVDLMSSLFPEIRVKRVIEVRGTDAVDAAMTSALPALWMGLLYDATARADARRLIQLPFEELVALQARVAVDALDAKLGQGRVLDVARDLVHIADEGLERRAKRGEPDERDLLEPLRSVVQSGRAPADKLLELYERCNGDRAALIAGLRY